MQSIVNNLSFLHKFHVKAKNPSLSFLNNLPRLIQPLPFQKKYFIPTLIAKIEEVSPLFIKRWKGGGGSNYACIYVFVAYPKIPSSNWEHQSRHDNSIPCIAISQIYRDTEQPQEKETLQYESRLQFSWRQFQQQTQCKSPNPIWKRKSTPGS